HQAARGDVVAPWVDCRYRVARRQRHQFLSATQKEAIIPDEEGANLQFAEGRKGRIEVRFAGSVEDMQLQSERERSLLSLYQLNLDIREGRVHEHADHTGRRHHLMQKLQALRP